MALRRDRSTARTSGLNVAAREVYLLVKRFEAKRRSKRAVAEEPTS